MCQSVETDSLVASGAERVGGPRKWLRCCPFLPFTSAASSDTVSMAAPAVSCTCTRCHLSPFGSTLSSLPPWHCHRAHYWLLLLLLLLLAG